MKFAIIVVLLAVAVHCQGQQSACENECAIDDIGSIDDAQIKQIAVIVDGAVGPNVAKLLAPVLINVVQKLPVLKEVSPAAYNLIIKLLQPCGLIEQTLANGKPVSFTAEQEKTKEDLQKQLTAVVGPNTGCFLARILTIAQYGVLSKLQLVVKVLNLVLCVATNPTLVKFLQPVLKIVQSLLSGQAVGNLLGDLVNGSVGGVLSDPLGNVGGLLKGTLGDLNKCLKAAGLDLNKATGGLLGDLTGGVGLGGIF